MRNWLIVILLATSFTVARADQKITEVQQNLKDQGFYYGDVNGEKNTETSDAIRRYQIRNGLSVTGELDEPTTQAIRKSEAAEQSSTVAPAPASPQPGATVRPLPPRDSEEDQAPAAQEPGAPFNPPPARPGGDIYQGRPAPERNEVFARTPYETAPPPVQRKVVMDAQRILSERGLFKFPIDGQFSPNLEFSLRAYQTRVGLRPTGRFDLETLAALELLPGSHRGIRPRPRVVVPNEPPVRGEWIRP
jgi:peptidoglycan hydrolase-like protein with peptidoglycan-binding domain